MRILLSNDDGILAEGIQVLAKVLSKKHEVIISAPMHQQSGMAHALHVNHPFEVARDEALEKSLDVEAWKMDGTPTDCVKLYLEALMEKKPDVVISGINHGANLATDVLYSGTVGAAMEGFLHNIVSFAVSLNQDSEISFEEAASLLEAYLESVVEQEAQPVLYNVNFPKSFHKGGPKFVYTRFGRRDYENAFERTVSKDGRIFYRIGGEILDLDKTEGTDIFAIENGFISVTPINIDITDYEKLQKESANRAIRLERNSAFMLK